MPDVVVTEIHLRKLRADTAMFCSEALQIQTKQGRLEPFAFNDEQSYVDQKVKEQRERLGKVRVLILKARQLGISTYCAGTIWHDCTLWGNRRGMVVADELSRSGEIFGIYERFRDHAPKDLVPPKRTAQRKKELAFTTDSRITVDTAGDADVGRATTIHRLHISELASWPRADESWTALMQAVPADSGEIYVESTAKGIGNLLYRLWTAAEAGENEWLAIFLPWWINDNYSKGVTEAERTEIVNTVDPWEQQAMSEGFVFDDELHLLSPEQLAWRRAKIRDDFLGDERAFRQEYPATAREAFVTSGDPYFDTVSLQTYDEQCRPPIRRGTFTSVGGGHVYQPSERGYVKIWEMPDLEGHYVAFGDTAEGKLAAASDASLNEADAEHGGRDFSALAILKVSELDGPRTAMGSGKRVGCLRLAATVHGRMAPEVFAQQVHAASAFYSCPGPPEARTTRHQALTGIERNHSSGQTVLRQLNEVFGHTDLFWHKRMNVRGRKSTTSLGWVTDGVTRMPMLDMLAQHIRSGTIEIYDSDTVRELFTFVRDEKGRPQAQEGAHDDRVIALAGAVQMSMNHREAPLGELPEAMRYDTPTGLPV